MKRVFTSVALCLVLPNAAAGQSIERNVIYGMHSGLALLMDVYRPARPNGYGVIYVAGSGWHTSLAYNAVPLKETQIPTWGPPLLSAGYTVFAINHRTAPRFHYPAAVEDVQRAVRFVRYNARKYGIDASRLGGVGGSSGAHLVGLVAMLGARGDFEDPDPVNREPATLQTVVLRAGRMDLRTTPVSEAAASWMEVLPRDPAARRLYAAASPITHITSGAPPVLLIHGDSDNTVPFDQSLAMDRALSNAGVPVKLIRIPGGEHGETFGASQVRKDGWPDYLAEMVNWLNKYSRK